MQVLPFLNNLKDLDLSYKTDLDLWDRFWKEKNPSYIWGNMVRKEVKYRIYPAIRRGFCSSRMTSNN